MPTKEMLARTEYGNRLLGLIKKQIQWRVLDWTKPYTAKDNIVKAGLDGVTGNVVSSIQKTSNSEPVHTLVLDIDHPAWLVRSSTPGHFHLYVDVPGGIPSEVYGRLLSVLTEAGVIEPGYAAASLARGYSCVRLPWIKKGQDA